MNKAVWSVSGLVEGRTRVFLLRGGQPLPTCSVRFVRAIGALGSCTLNPPRVVRLAFSSF